MRRYEQLCPQWQIGIFTLDKREDTNTQIDRTIEMLEKLKEYRIQDKE